MNEIKKFNRKKWKYSGEFAATALKFELKEEVVSFFTTANLREHYGKVFNYFKGSPYDAYGYFHKEGYIALSIAAFEFENSYNHM